MVFLMTLSGTRVQGIDSRHIGVVQVLRSPKDAANQPVHFRAGPGDLEIQLEVLKGEVIESQTNRMVLEGKLKDLQVSHTGLEGKFKEAQADKTELEANLKKAAADRERFEAKLNQVAADRMELEVKLKEAAADRERFAAKLKQDAADRMELEVKLKEAAADRKRLGAELEQAQADRSGLEAKLKEAQAARAKEAEKLRALQQETNQLKGPPPQSPTKRSSSNGLFREGVDAYRAADYSQAAEAFRQSVTLQPASGALQSLGNVEWQQRRTGDAILAWEQALWLDPFNDSARQNLRFARKAAQLEAPELAWYEVISTWLPVSWWAWIAGGSLWLAIGMGSLPGLLRRRKATWHQAIAALALMVLLLSVPALFGVQTRARIGFVLPKDTPLRLTPTLEAQVVTRLAPGDPARWVRARGRYVLIRTSRAVGWVEQDQFGLTCPRTGRRAG